MSTEKKTHILKMDEERVQLLNRIKTNPADVIEYVYALLSDQTNGEINIPSPTNPFSYLVECSAMQMSTLAIAHEALYRKQYPKLALNYEDLYNHMSDEDYIGRFATPGTAEFSVAFKKLELIQILNDIPGDNKKITIPRGTTITFNDIVFTYLYDIDIILLRNENLRILYRNNEIDPLVPLRTNIVDSREVNVGNEIYIETKLFLKNIKIEQYKDNLVQTTGYSKEIELHDKFVLARVYMKMGDGELRELKTTHSDLVYDLDIPTARLTYLENTRNKRIRVEIPQIYYHENKIGKEIIIELYTSKGAIEERLDYFAPDMFDYKIGSLVNKNEDDKHVVPIEGLSSLRIQAMTSLTGGTDGMSFDVLRDKVINYANYVKQPITSNQLATTLYTEGFDVLKSRDTLTSRTYIATKIMPKNVFSGLTIGSSLDTIGTSINDLKQSYGVIQNQHNFTITPDCIFKYIDGGVAILREREIPSLERLNVEDYLKTVNTLDYIYTPFYYVINTHNTLKVNAYYLDKPELSDLTFISNNQTSGLSASSDQYHITKYKNSEDDQGFIIRIKMKAVEEFKNIPKEKLFCQLATIPHGDTSYAYINGTLLGNISDPDEKPQDYIWEFKLQTKWDLPTTDSINITNFKMYLDEYRTVPINLEGEFHFIYGLTDTVILNYEKNDVDKIVNKIILPNQDIIAITHDKLSYKLGDWLDNLWTNALYVRDKPIYERYEEDIPRRYSHDVYEIDENGSFILNNDDLKIIHHAGDLILDEDGNQILLARKGDVRLDDNGLPIIKANNDLKMLLDIFLLDAVYKFSTDSNDMDYIQYVTKSVRDYVCENLVDIKYRLLENTDLYFTPKTTIGNKILTVDNNANISQAIRIPFEILYYVTDRAYRDNQIRNEIESATSKIINDLLRNRTVSLSDLAIGLQNIDKVNIVGVDVGEFNKTFKYSTYTMKDDSTRCSVKQVLKKLPDGTFKVIEDIKVSFVKHDR